MLTRLPTVLPLLLCPLLMLACMWAMRNRETPQARGGEQELSTVERIARLERELAELRARLPAASPAADDPQPPRPLSSPVAVQGAPAPPGLTSRR
jgi:hypothetical protein